jgi:hypothetical protein
MSFRFEQPQAQPQQPLSIDTNVSLASSAVWSSFSPFSAPSFSPLPLRLGSPSLHHYSSSAAAAEAAAHFQYANAGFYSPACQRRGIYKKPSSVTTTNGVSGSSSESAMSPMITATASSAVEASMKRWLPKRSEQIDMSEHIRQAATQRALGGRVKMCTFCKSNGESELVYSSHALKDSYDKITCPILQRYACPYCGATAENAHTINYCPVLQKKRRLDKLRNLVKPSSASSLSSSSSSSSSSE